MVSVLMPVRNEAGRVTDAVNSILSQTYKNIELIVIDDHSADKTWQELNRIIDPRLKLYHSPCQMGLAKQLNRAAEMSTGELLARQDGDDISLPARLELQVAVYLRFREQVSIIATEFWKTDELGQLFVKFTIDSDASYNRLIHLKNSFAHGSLMFPKNLFKSIGGYDEELRTAQDLDLLLKLSSLGEIKCVPQPLYIHVVRKSNATARRGMLDVINRFRIASTAFKYGVGVSTFSVVWSLLRYSWRVLTGVLVSKESLYELKMGLLREHAGDEEKAIDMYRNALRLCPWNLAVIKKLASKKLQSFTK